MGFPGGSIGASQVALVVKNLPAKAGDSRDTGLIPGLGRSTGERTGKLLQYSCLGNPINGGTIVHRVPRVRHDLVTKQQIGIIMFWEYLSRIVSLDLCN